MLGIARGRDATVPQEQRASGFVASGIDGRDADFPTLLAGRGIAYGDVAAGGDQSPTDSPALENLQPLISGETLGDAAQIQAHVWCQQSYRARLRIQVEFGIADRSRRGSNFLRGRKDSFLAGKSPQTDIRPHCHVECAMGKL